MFLAMEYMPLGDLEQNIQEIENSPVHDGPALSEEAVQEIARQILEGLNIMHAEGFAHRDLKPQNVFVVQRQPQWWVKIGDFGLSKKQIDNTAFRTRAGTQQYMAPEFFYYLPDLGTETTEYTSAVDLWALGCITYRLISGAVPFPSLLTLKNFCGDPVKFPLNMPPMMEESIKFIGELLQPHPAKRPSAGEALASSWFSQSIFSSLSDSSVCRLIFKTDKPNFSLQEMQPVYTSMDMSASQNDYNTTTHKGLQSYHSNSTMISPPQALSNSGLTTVSLPQPTRTPILDSVTSKSLDAYDAKTKRQHKEITTQPAQIQEQSAETLASLGNDAMRKKDYHEAMVIYTRALEIMPNNPAYLSNRSATHSALENYAAACTDAEAAIAADPKYTKAWSRLGFARLMLGDARGSVDAYTKGIEYEGQEGSEAMSRGLEYANKRLKQLEEAAFDNLVDNLETAKISGREFQSNDAEQDLNSLPVASTQALQTQQLDTSVGRHRRTKDIPYTKPTKPGFFSRLLKVSV